MKFDGFAEWHKRMRIQRGITQGQIAKQLGWSSSQYISNIERGKSFLPKSRIKKISKIYKVSETYIALLVVNDIKQMYLDFVRK